MLLFLARAPLLLLAFFAIGAAFWIVLELFGDSQMIEVTGTVVETESVLSGEQTSPPPERADLPCRYPSGSAFSAGPSTGWFLVEHDRGTVLFCSGSRQVGTAFNLWVDPSQSWDGRLVAPTFTVPQALLWLLVTIVTAAGLLWGWAKLRSRGLEFRR